MSVRDLNTALLLNYEKLPEKLKKHYRSIQDRTDLPISNPEHRYSNDETRLLIEWLETTDFKNKENLINHVIKVNKYGDI